MQITVQQLASRAVDLFIEYLDRGLTRAQAQGVVIEEIGEEYRGYVIEESSPRP